MRALAALQKRRRSTGSFFPRNQAGELTFRILPGILEKEPMAPDFDPQRAIEEGPKACAMVYRCITGKAERASQVPWRVWRLKKSGAAKGGVDEAHPLNAVIEHPHLLGAYGRQELIYRSVQYLEACGNSLVRLSPFPYREYPAQLVPESPVAVEPVPDKAQWISRYDYEDGDGQTKSWQAKEIVHAQYPDPSNPHWGLSRLQALTRTVDLYQELERLALKRAVNDGRPSTVFVDKSVTTRQQREEAEDRLFERRERYRGGFMVIGGEQTLLPLGVSNADLQVLEILATNRDLIAIGFGYLPAGFSNDAATYNNSAIFVRHEWHLAMYCNRVLAEALTRRLVPRAEWGKVWLGPDYSEVEALQEDKSEVATAIKALTDARISTNDAKRYLTSSIPDQIGGDVPFAPSGLVPVTTLIEESLAQAGMFE